MCPFFSYVIGLQIKIFYFNENRRQQKCFLWEFCQKAVNDEGILLK